MANTFKLNKPVFDISPPATPKKPVETPILELDQVFYEDNTKTAVGKSIPLLEALKKVGDFPLDKIKISFKRIGNVYDVYSLAASIKIHGANSKPNPKYQVALDAYEAAVKAHKGNQDAFLVEKKKHENLLLLWNKATELKKVKAKKKRTIAETAKLKSIPVAMKKLLKTLKLDFTPADVIPLPAIKPVPFVFEPVDDDYYDDDNYDDGED